MHFHNVERLLGARAGPPRLTHLGDLDVRRLWRKGVVAVRRLPAEVWSACAHAGKRLTRTP
eukprot:4648209-Prymnesium_polylepis.1